MPLSVRPLLAVLVLALIAASPAAADTDPTVPVLFDLEFRGGAVNDYVKAIRGQNEQANIVIMADAGNVAVPAVELRSVTVMTALSVLDGLSEMRQDRQTRLLVEEQGPEQIVTRTTEGSPGPRRLRHIPIGIAVYTIHAEVKRITQFGGPVADTSQVMAVSELLEEVSPEALLTAIQTSLDLLGEDLAPARIKFHEDTGLIIARGHPEQMQAIALVIDQIRDTVRQRQHLKRKADDREQRETEIILLRAALAEAEGEREALRREMLMFQSRMELLQRELDESRAQLMAARAEKDQLTDIAHRLEMEIARLQDERKRKQ